MVEESKVVGAPRRSRSAPRRGPSKLRSFTLTNLRKSTGQVVVNQVNSLDDDLRDLQRDGIPVTFLSDSQDPGESLDGPGDSTENSISVSDRFRSRKTLPSKKTKTFQRFGRKPSAQSVMMVASDQFESPANSTGIDSQSVDELLLQEDYVRKKVSAARRTGTLLTEKELIDMGEHFREVFNPNRRTALLPRKILTVSGVDVVEWLIEHGYALDSAEAAELGHELIEQKALTITRKREREFDPFATYRLT